ncbi:hypothetical protein T492DRAFT_964619, partial [Pavlovales sp. CCMP2436]
LAWSTSGRGRVIDPNPHAPAQCVRPGPHAPPRPRLGRRSPAVAAAGSSIVFV